MRAYKEQHHFIELIYVEFFGSLFAYARSSLGNDALAEEAVQDVFRIACVKSSEFMNSPNPKGWLVNTLKNVIRDVRRTQARTGKLLVTLAGGENLTIGMEDNQSITDLHYSDLISVEEYRLLKRIVFDRYTMIEAADELGITVEACKKRIQRTKAKLRQKLMDLHKI